MVRTTDTGGIKLIYNGAPNSSGNCNGTYPIVATTKYNDYSDSPAYVGYKYGALYFSLSKSINNSSYVYGNSFQFEDVDPNVSGDGTYTLKDTITSATKSTIATHHYTCFNTTGKCSSVSYVYYVTGTTGYYISFSDGKNVDDTLAAMQKNQTGSLLNQELDKWFAQTFAPYFTNQGKSYNTYLEDTIWCGDRSYKNEDSLSAYATSGWNPNGGTGTYGIWNYLRFGGLNRIHSGTVNLSCNNKIDSYTVNETERGNGTLSYPIGALTSDEVNLAGAIIYESTATSTNSNRNTSFYLGSPQSWWTMSPFRIGDKTAQVFFLNSSGALQEGWNNVNTSALGVRPAISLAHDVKIADGGDGTYNNPYEVIVE